MVFISFQNKCPNSAFLLFGTTRTDFGSANLRRNGEPMAWKQLHLPISLKICMDVYGQEMLRMSENKIVCM